MGIHELAALVLGGLGAGLMTGFIGASAVVVGAPLLIAVAGMTPYIAVGLSLAVDVASSLTATAVYHRYRNVDIQRALTMLLFALAGVIAGSTIAVRFPEGIFGLVIGCNTLIAGVAILMRRRAARWHVHMHGWRLFAMAALAGVLLGLNAGILGAGGGIMVFVILTTLLGYRAHVAVGTAVLCMAFIALFGAITHYIAQPFSMSALGIMSLSGVVGALLSARFANALPEQRLNIIAGMLVILLGVILIVERLYTIYMV
jgi:hypothetical protein